MLVVSVVVVVSRIRSRHLTSGTHPMSTFQPVSYGPVFEPLLVGDRRRALDAGDPNPTVQEALEKLTLESAFAHMRIVDLDMGRCCLAGVWMIHDYLDHSHTISQGVDTPSGSYWHALVHR